VTLGNGKSGETTLGGNSSEEGKNSHLNEGGQSWKNGRASKALPKCSTPVQQQKPWEKSHEIANPSRRWCTTRREEAVEKD